MDVERDPGERVQEALAGAWQGTDLADVLGVIVDGVVQVAGFGAAALSVRTGAEGFEVVAVSGDQPGLADLVGAHIPRSALDAELADAERWGPLLFVPHGGVVQLPSWVPDLEPIDDPEAWHPLDLLMAPIVDETGEWIGLLSVDLPEDGKRPGPEQRRLLERYAEQASGALARAIAQDQLDRRVRLAGIAREVVRRASTRLSVEEVLAECRLLMTDAFRAKGMWIDIPPSRDGVHPGSVFVSSEEFPDVEVPPVLVAAGRRIAKRCWAEQQAILVSRFSDRHELVGTAEQRAILDFLATLNRSSVLLAPLGAGSECLGTLVLSRDQTGPSWTDVEAQAALDIGHDLGAAVLNARMRERDQEVVDQLRAIDEFRSGLISTVAREFQTPLSSIVGNLERIQHFLDDPEQRAVSLAGLARGSSRLIELVDRMVEYRRVVEPEDARVVEPVDLGDCLRECADQLAARAQPRSLDVSATKALVTGVHAELRAVCANLLDNALRFTDPDGRVRATVRREDGNVVLSVADNGIGISPGDQERLFEEFFRSTNAEALRRAGCGLGLAIVRRVVERYGGSVRVESVPGRGTTVEVRLPDAT
jgi:signal transduction histidine kinase